MYYLVRGNNYYYNNLPFQRQRPLGKSILVLFCCDIRRDEEKETQHINVVGKNDLWANRFLCAEPEPTNVFNKYNISKVNQTTHFDIKNKKTFGPHIDSGTGR